MKSRTNVAILSVLVLGLGVGTVRGEEAEHVFLEIERMTGFHGLSQVAGDDVSEWIEVLAFSDGLLSSTSSGRTRARGRTEAAEIVVKKRVDQSTPLFYQALAQNEAIPTADFHFYGTDYEEGSPLKFYQVTLIDVRVSSVTTTYEKGVGLVQEIKFVAKRIQWSYFGQGGVSESTFEAF